MGPKGLTWAFKGPSRGFKKGPVPWGLGRARDTEPPPNKQLLQSFLLISRGYKDASGGLGRQSLLNELNLL